jgi:hypothetical protein
MGISPERKEEAGKALDAPIVLSCRWEGVIAKTQKLHVKSF